MHIINTERIPIKIWAESVESLDEQSMEQAKNLAALPFAFKHIALMPDTHAGYGMPIGGILAAEGTVIPNAVGVDIGCGMVARPTNLEGISRRELEHVRTRILQAVPVGFDHLKKPRKWDGFLEAPDVKVVREELPAAAYQLGTLGGGNHFIELQQGSDGRIWVMVHSGSRNFGLKIAGEFHKRAKGLCGKRHVPLPSPDLAYLPMDTAEAGEYFEAMNFTLAFARANRDVMMEAALDAVVMVTGGLPADEPVNIHHNYAAREHHFGKDVIIHRKGAVSAKEGQPGIIPGSQGSKSYIVRGKGNPDSFMSSSHGAGRRMGRKQAIRELNLREEIRRMDRLGIVHGMHREKDLDEAAGAYKNIDEVMAQQRDLVEIVTELTPLMVVKG